jgi:type I restriction enzyme S subunit
MEVRPGYKRTEAGLIPEDWDAVPINALTPPNRRNAIVDGPFGSNLKTIHYRTSGIPIITSGYVTDGVFRADKYLYVDRAKFLEERRSAVQPGDIVMAKIGERCGASAILPDTHETGILSGNALKISIDESRHSTSYVWHVLWYLHISGQLDVLRTVGAQPALSMANLKRYRLPVPSTKTEQGAIGMALNDMDALLDGLDRLIAKKRDLKQAVMQQLLTGQIRLPGFSGEWEVKSLGDLGVFLKGGGVSKDQASGGSLACVRYGELYTHHHDVIRDFFSWISPEVALAATRLRSGDILFAGSGETKEEIGKCAAFVGGEEAYAGGDIVILRPYDGDSVFLGYLLNSTSVNRQKASRGQGDAVVHISSSALAAIRCRLPGPPEQTAIATALSDMDAEIAALEARREKTLDLQHAMMQELLTGKTRLVH